MTSGALSHNVFFTLHDSSERAKAQLVEACRQFLNHHPGIVFFAVGTLCSELRREVNDLEFDVALHIVFDNQKSQDAYQLAARHDQFIAENKTNWKKVRVFDSVVDFFK